MEYSLYKCTSLPRGMGLKKQARMKIVSTLVLFLICALMVKAMSEGNSETNQEAKSPADNSRTAESVNKFTIGMVTKRIDPQNLIGQSFNLNSKRQHSCFIKTCKKIKTFIRYYSTFISSIIASLVVFGALAFDFYKGVSQFSNLMVLIPIHVGAFILVFLSSLTVICGISSL